MYFTCRNVPHFTDILPIRLTEYNMSFNNPVVDYLLNCKTVNITFIFTNMRVCVCVVCQADGSELAHYLK